MNKPAFSLLDFSEARFTCPVAAPEAELLSALGDRFPALNHPITPLGALRPAGPVAADNIYQIDSAGGRWLVKMKFRRNPGELSVLEDLLLHLRAMRLGIVCPEPDEATRLFPHLPDGRFVEVVAFHEGRHIRGESDLLAALGRAVSRLHAGLASFPGVARIEANSQRHEARLAACYAAIRDGVFFKRKDDYGRWFRKNRDYTDQLSANWRSLQDLPEQSEPMHGDLNRGNVLAADGRRNIVFLDFEDAPFAWMPVCFELAFIVQRFMLYDEPNEHLLKGRLAAFFNAYRPYKFPLNVLDLLALWSYRSTVRIASRALSSSQAALDRAEMDKFVYLHNHFERYRKLLDDCLS